MYLIKTPKLISEYDFQSVLIMASKAGSVRAIMGPPCEENEDAAEYPFKMLDMGLSVVAMNIEKIHPGIMAFCEHLGAADCNAYVSPEGKGSSFGLHKDDMHVLLINCYGNKKYRVVRNGEDKFFEMDKGFGLFLPKGDMHEGIPIGKSCVLSFGIYDEPINICIDTRLDGLEIP